MDVETFLNEKKLVFSKEFPSYIWPDSLTLKFCQEMLIYAIKNNNRKYGEMLKSVLYIPHIETLENALKNGEDENVIREVVYFQGVNSILYDIVFKNCDRLLDLFFKQKWTHTTPLFEYLVQHGKNKYVRQYLDTFGIGPFTLKGMVAKKISYAEIDRLAQETPYSCTRKILLSYLPWAPVRYWNEMTTNFFDL